MKYKDTIILSIVSMMLGVTCGIICIIFSSKHYIDENYTGVIVFNYITPTNNSFCVYEYEKNNKYDYCEIQVKNYYNNTETFENCVIGTIDMIYINNDECSTEKPIYDKDILYITILSCVLILISLLCWIYIYIKKKREEINI